MDSINIKKIRHILRCCINNMYNFVQNQVKSLSLSPKPSMTLKLEQPNPI